MTASLALTACGGEASESPDSGTLARDLPLKDPCNDNAECASGLCFTYNAFGKRCTHTCTATTAATDCPAPYMMLCSGMGVCKYQ